MKVPWDGASHHRHVRHAVVRNTFIHQVLHDLPPGSRGAPSAPPWELTAAALRRRCVRDFCGPGENTLLRESRCPHTRTPAGAAARAARKRTWPPHSDVERRSHRPRRCRGSAAPPCASTAPTGRRRERTRPSSLLPTGASLRSASRRRYRTSRGRNAPRANVTPEGYRTSRGRHAPRAVVAVGSAASSSKAEKPWGSILPLFGELLFS